jgi:hypothetical protein
MTIDCFKSELTPTQLLHYIDQDTILNRHPQHCDDDAHRAATVMVNERGNTGDLIDLILHLMQERAQIVRQVRLDALIEKARSHIMTPEQQQAQAKSFVYGNVALSNPAVTREMVEEAFKL